MTREETLKQIAKTISSGDIPKEIYDKYLSETPIGFMNSKELFEYLENQELKKQLNNCYCNRTDCVGRIKDSKVYDSLEQKMETQQKEFIKWLEVEIKKAMDTMELLSDTGSCRIPYLKSKKIVLEEILQKYKSIIGVSDEKEN